MKQWFLPLGIALMAACQQVPATQQQQIADTITTTPLTETADAPALTERDTVTIGEVLYDMTDIERAEFDAVPGYQAEHEKENENMRRYAEKVFRRGDSLILLLDDGSSKVLKTIRGDGEDHIEYYFLDHIPALKAYLVYILGYEYYSYQLVHTATGVTTHMIGVPQLSPDKTSFICSNADLVAGFTTNGFQLFRTGDKDTIDLLQEYQPEHWGPVTIKWKDARSFVAHLNERDREMNEKDRFVKLVPR